MGFVLGYGAHCFELYGIRTWLVAFWTFVAMKNADSSPLTPIVVSVLFSLLAMPASVLGNELALRFGRHRVITAVMFSSALVALLIGVFSDQSPWFLLPFVVIYAITVPADSGALTSGMTMAANPSYRGATMAAHSTVGFSLSALGAWAVGVALDAAGGPLNPSAWMAAFSVLAAGILLGPVALYWSRKAPTALKAARRDAVKSPAASSRRRTLRRHLAPGDIAALLRQSAKAIGVAADLIDMEVALIVQWSQ